MRVNAGVHWKQISSKKKKSLSYCSLPCQHILWNLRSNEIMITVVFTVIVTIVIRMLILSYHLPSWYHLFFSSVHHGHQQTLQPVKLSQILNQTFTVLGSCLLFIKFWFLFRFYCLLLYLSKFLLFRSPPYQFPSSISSIPAFVPPIRDGIRGGEEKMQRERSQSKQNVTKWDLFDLDQIF